jgi:peptide/nickel transport system permease protein
MDATTTPEPTGLDTVTGPPANDPQAQRPTRTLATLARHAPFSIYLSAAVVLVFIVFAIGGSLIAPDSSNSFNLSQALLPPGSAGHILGTDQYGRDILSRIIDGTRISLAFTVISIVLAAVFGTLIGVLGGMAASMPGLSRLARVLDPVLSGFVNVTLSIPVILIALLLSVTVGYEFWILILILVVFAWPPYAKVAREGTIVACSRPSVELAVIAGVSYWSIARRHIIPAIADSLIVVGTLQVGYILIVSATLDFLGVGVPPPAPTWGGMVSDGLNVLSQAWWVSIMPAIAIGLIVLAANTIGDWLRRALDPSVELVRGAR